jgi:hypothetical protein
LTSLDVSHNDIGQLVLPEGWYSDHESGYEHTDGREQKKNPGKPEGCIALANAIPDMRALASVNLLKNKITMVQAKALASILQEHPTLKSLCGNSGEETKLDMSGKQIRAAGAIMLAPEITANVAMTSLNLSSNDIGGYWDGKNYIVGPKIIATPEGTLAVTAVLLTAAHTVFCMSYRPSCYCRCHHQEYGGIAEN